MIKVGQVRLTESKATDVPILGERRVMWDFLIEAQSGEPSPRQMHTQFFHQLALARDAL